MTSTPNTLEKIKVGEAGHELPVVQHGLLLVNRHNAISIDNIALIKWIPEREGYYIAFRQHVKLPSDTKPTIGITFHDPFSIGNIDRFLKGEQ